ncbi:hypothetical protein 13VV501A_gene0036 [Vibrio phage 13VV501A]|nr:hypothetical protein 13VV501A_gene0036 [Vibrio phage 13VV501A]
MKLNYQPIIEWARTRGILDQSTAQFQMLKATEEHGEMAGAILRGDRDELIDAIGDQLVVAIVQCAQLGYDVGEAAYACITYHFSGNRESTLAELCHAALQVTAAQGSVSCALAKGRDASYEFRVLFTTLFALCAVENISPHEALDSVYAIISKRGGEMRNGVWVKTEDL